MLGIRNQGTNATQIGSTTTTVSYSGTNIATYTGGTGTNALVISFNTNAVNESVQALARNLTFQNVSHTPVNPNRVVSFELTDGKGGTNEPTSVTISLVCPDALDLMVLFDVSNSMIGVYTNGVLSSNDVNRYWTAKAAASNFVSLLDFTTDRVGLIAFADAATLEVALTTNGPSVQASIYGQGTTSGTILSPPIEMARTNFTGSGSNTLRLMVILSDGEEFPYSNYANTVAAANAAKDEGIRIISVGFYTGENIYQYPEYAGTNLLKEIASSSLDFYFAPSFDEIQSNFVAVAQGLCRANYPPAVAIDTPTNGAFFPGLSVPITASASDVDGVVTNLAVFHGSTNIGSGTGTSLTFTWTPPGGGNYSIHAQATDDAGATTTSALVSITVNGGPAVNAGADLELMLIGTNSVFTNLSGTVTDADNLPAGRELSIVWSGVSGVGPTFLVKDPADPTEPRKAKVTFTKPGIYSMRLTASDSLLSVSDDMTITVNKTNEAPQVYAGPDQTILFPDAVYLPGAVSDDGAPIGGELTVLWSGPSGVEFASDSVTNTFARFSAPGVYELSLIATDGESGSGGLSTTQHVTITVNLPQEQTMYRNADVVSGGTGGMRGAFGSQVNPLPGSGTIAIAGLVTNVKQAFLYWAGPVDSENRSVNASVLVNGRLVEGMNIGHGHSDDWNYENGIHAFSYAYSYRADITSMVRSQGNGNYALASLVKGREVEVNGASIIVIQDSVDAEDPHDVILWNGNDSNESLDFYPSMTDSSHAIYAIAASGSRVFIGGNFGSYNITNRNHFAVLDQDGRLDATFAVTSGFAPDGSTIHSILPMIDGSVLVAGAFTTVEGETRNRLARFESSGVLATNFNLDINGSVVSLALDQNDNILIGGFFTSIDGNTANKVARLLPDGQVDTNFSAPTIDGPVIAVASDRNTNVLIGGSFSLVNGSIRHGLARLNGSGTLQGSSDPNVATTFFPGIAVRAILPSESGTILIGGDLTSVSGTNRYGLARVNENLTLDDTFTNSVAGTRIVDGNNVGVAAVHALVRSGTNQVVFAGRFVKVDGVLRERIAILNEDTATLDDFASTVVPDLIITTTDEITSINAVALRADGTVLAGGAFATINGGLPASGTFGLLSDGSLDPSFRVNDSGSIIAFADVFHVSGDDVSIELHVSDGQPDGGSYCRADPPILLNGELWMDNLAQVTCTESGDSQIFAGESVPSAYWLCNQGAGLWDITNRVVPSSLLTTGAQTLLLTTSEDFLCGGADLVTLVAAVVRMPADTNATQPNIAQPPVEHPPIAWEDEFTLSRGVGRLVLNVLGNDICPAGGLLKISSVTLPANGRCEIIYEASAILYSVEPGYAGTNEFAYTVVDENGNFATTTVTVAVVGGQDAVAISMGQQKNGTLGSSGYQTLVRGGGQHADYYRFGAGRGDSVDIVVSNAAFSPHVYVLNPRGEIVASGGHATNGTIATIPDMPVQESGIYTIEVTTHEAGESGAYVLYLSATPASYVAELEVNGAVLDENTPYFLGVVEVGESLTNSFALRNRGRKQIDEANLSISALQSTTSITPSTSGPLPVGRAVPVTTIITPFNNGLIYETNTISQANGSRRYTLSYYANPSGAIATPVTMTAPADGSVLRAPGSVVVSAVVIDDVNEITNVTKVEFYADGPARRQKLGEAAGPYEINRQKPEPGTYQLFAVANMTVLGDEDLMAVSPAITVTIARENYNSRPLSVADVLSVPLNSKTNFLNVLANDSDADGDTLRIISITGTTQGALSISGDGLGIIYTPPADTFGEEGFAYTVDDGRNGRATAVATVKIVSATAAITDPVPDETFAEGSTNAIVVEASTSQGSILNVEVFANGVKVGMVSTNPFVVNWAPPSAGFYTLKAVAYDSSGNRIESAPVPVGVGDPGASPPIALISNLRDNDRLRSGVFDLLGTADSTNSETVSYQLKLWKQTTNEGVGELEVADFTPLELDVNGFHLGAVASGGLLATLDFTGIRNGVYTLKLAVQSGGKVSRTEVRFALENNAKLGQLTFSEEDLVVPLGGIPISVIRTYDSLKTDLGDFGTSWTYSINDLEVEIDEVRGIVEDDDEPPNNFSMRLGGGRNVTLTLPGGQRTTFLYSLNPGPNEGGVPCFCYEAKWEAAPGVYAQLAPLDNNRLQFIPWQQVIPPYWVGAGDTPFDTYDFSGFVLTNSDGTEYILEGDELGFHPLPPEGAQLRSVQAYSAPKLRKIRTRSGDEIRLVHLNVSGTNHLRVEQFNPLQQPAIQTNSILLVHNSANLITAAYGPESLNADGTLKSGAVASVRYAYSNQFLVAVERLVNSSPVTYETNRYEYTNSTHPHFITGIIDARGVRVATTGKDAQGRLTSLRAPGQAQGTRFIHDAANLREIAIDPLGHRTIHEFDRRGNVVRSIDALGQVTRRDYDDAGNQLSETDALGHTQWFGYDALGNRTSTVDALGRTNTASFGERRLLLSTADALGRGVTNAYDSADNLIHTTNALGQVTSQLYDSRGLLAASLDALGTLTTNRYDANGRLINTATLSAQSSILSSNAYAYDERGNRTNETTWVTIHGTLRTLTNAFEFDARNRLVRSLDALGYTNTTTYNALGKAESTTDKMGRETRFWFDARGNLIQTAYPSDANTPAAITRTVYDELNRPVYAQWRVAANDPVDSGDTTAPATRTIYDALGRVARTESRTNVVIGWTELNGAPATVLVDAGQMYADTTTEFDEAGRVLYQTDAQGVTTYFDYDATGRRIATTVYDDDSRAMTTRTLYDAAGNAVVTLDALGRGTTNVLDTLYRSIEMQLADGATRHTIFDDAGRRIGEVDQAGVTNRFGFDGLGRLEAVTNAWATANETWATYRYDEQGRQTNQMDALGRATQFDFDELGRRIGRTLPGGQSEGFAYNAAGNMTWHTNFNGQTIRMDYDAVNRLLAKVYPDGTSNTFAYTITGQRSGMVDASGMTTNFFDARDRLIQRQHHTPGAYTPEANLDYTYDARGNLETILIYNFATSLGSTTSYEYDSLNRLAGANDAPLNTTPNTTRYSYDVVGNLESVETPTGVAHDYRYNALNRLTNMVVLAGSVALAQYDYTLGVTGQRDGLIEHVNGAYRTNDWKYDRQYRLTNELLKATSGAVTGHLAYAYDIVANRTNRTSTLSSLISTNSAYNTNDWLTADVYDSAGNTRTNAAGIIYEYNADNQVTNVINGTTNIALTYNADGQRIMKSVVVGTTTNKTYYVVDDRNPTGYAQVLEEWTIDDGFSASPRRFYLYGLDLISQHVQNGDTNYYGYDGHGSVRFLTGAGTNVTDTYTFDAYGTLIDSTGTTPNHYLYAGEQLDEDLGMYYLRARYMIPESGRFLTMDSYEGTNEDPLSLHKYLYVHGNPVSGIDPSGHFTLTEINSSMGSIVNLSTRLYSALNKVYKVKNALEQVQFLYRMLSVVESVASASQGGFGPALLSGVQDLLGVQQLNAAAFMTGFDQMFAGIGSHWDDIAKAITAKVPAMATHAASRALQVFPKLATSRNLTLAFDLPSPPIRSWSGIPGITLHTQKGDVEFRSSRYGGRFLGIQIKTGPNDYQTLLRIDYWDFQSGPLGQLGVHYHVANESAGGKHPAGQKIWP